MSQNTRYDALWHNVHLATMDAARPGELGIIEDGALLTSEGRISWVGARRELPQVGEVIDEHDGHGAWLTPGLVDCHTHLVYGGSRAAEFEMRLQGQSYESIARAGGGIASTVRATRAAGSAELLRGAAQRLADLRAQGVTTIEVKSGYAQNIEGELRMLGVARELGRQQSMRIVTTLLAAHVLPEEFADRADAYVDLVCEEMIPRAAAAGSADAVDAFCESIAFNAGQVARVFSAARAHGLPVKLHADQLSDGGGAALAARYQALSADHLEFTSAAGVKEMASAATVAVLLPTAFYFLRETRIPPIDLLRQHRVPMALASDCNPGSSPCTSLLLVLNMACTLFRMTPGEALLGVTRHGAQALGLQHEIGQLREGQIADLALWDISHPRELCYAMGANPLVAAVESGIVRPRLRH